MEAKFQTSFIPKKPIVIASPGTRARAPRNLFSMIAVLIFVASLIAAIGLFAYSKYLQYQNDAMKAKVQDHIKSFDPALTQELTALNSRILASQELLSKHISLSSLFSALQLATLKTVQYESFNFSATPGGKATLSLRGKTRNYSSLAFQADVVGRSKAFSSPVFSGLGLDERGDVTFDLKLAVAPQAISYRATIIKDNATTTPATNAPVTAPTASSTKPSASTTTPAAQ